MKFRFNGTLFRLPFRNLITAADSNISKMQHEVEDALNELISNFSKVF
jgi:hypothetical protein